MIHVKMTEDLIYAIDQCSQDAAPDMGEGGDDPESVAEVVFSMLDFRFPKARTELTQLLKRHSYKAVLAEAVKHVSTL